MFNYKPACANIIWVRWEKEEEDPDDVENRLG